jgi:hypothetical protein
MGKLFWSIFLVVIWVRPTVAEPVLLYGPDTGSFWLAGLPQTDSFAGIALYSQSGTLLLPEHLNLLFGYPIDINSGSSTYGRWIREELGISVGNQFLPLYLGQLADPGTQVNDLSAIYFPAKFTPSQPLLIQVVPEPGSFNIAAIASLIALGTRRQNRLHHHGI